MAIKNGIFPFYSGNETAADSTRVPAKKFTLPALSDAEGLLDPQTGKHVTARALRTNVAGTIAVVDPYGNITTESLAAGDLIKGLCNGILVTGTVTITAADITVYL